jgi:hypothetical protein
MECLNKEEDLVDLNKAVGHKWEVMEDLNKDGHNKVDSEDHKWDLNKDGHNKEDLEDLK